MTVYRSTIKIDWSKVINPKARGTVHAKRGKVGGMSVRSGQRLTAELADAPKRWGFMATLTFRERIMDGTKALRKFDRLMKPFLDEDVHTAWVREYQERGAVHYHYLWSEDFTARANPLQLSNICHIKSAGKTREVVRGYMDEVVRNCWMRAVGDTHPDFIAFQKGGILQRWVGENGASNYFGSYMAKAKQKQLPEDAECSGRWWYICPAAKPRPVGTGYLTQYKRAYPLGRIFDREELIDHIAPSLPVFIPKWGDRPK